MWLNLLDSKILTTSKRSTIQIIHKLEDGHRFDATVSTWIHLPPRQPAVALTFDLQNLIRSSVGDNEYSLSGLSKLFKVFMRYRGNDICPDERRWVILS